MPGSVLAGMSFHDAVRMRTDFFFFSMLTVLKTFEIKLRCTHMPTPWFVCVVDKVRTAKPQCVIMWMFACLCQ